MKKIILLAMLFVLAGCEPGARTKIYPVLPDELKDCKFFIITDDSGGHITVARCPNSTTTTRQNDKRGTTSVIIDGKEYVAK